LHVINFGMERLELKIALFGATGNIGSRILHEALARGHDVTSIVRDPERLNFSKARLNVVRGNVLESGSVAATVAGHDVVISAVGPRKSESPKMIVDAARSLIEGLTAAGVRRLVVSGGAGSLEVAPGVQLVNTPEFPTAWKPVPLAHREALGILRASTLDWTYLSPANEIVPGKRTGHYRVGTDQLVVDTKGKSLVSMEDYAMAALDDVEKPRFVRRRFTVAY
jgi:putative NADH-flavin reductase